MGSKITVVINTLNAEKDITRAVRSVQWAQEIIVCDMYSTDKTVDIVKKMGAKVIYHKNLKFVEPARNFAISKASNEWVFILDPDEEIPKSLKEKLIEVTSRMKKIDYVRIPRKNIIFGRFMQAAMWWPDYNIRFFKKGSVRWTDEIHRPPKVQGQGLDLPAEEELAIIHHNYQTISQFIARMDRYTSIQARQLVEQNFKIKWSDLIEKPLSEFLSRFFVGKGYQDGLHGLALSFLQAFSFLLVYLKIWEQLGFKENSIEFQDLEHEKSKAAFQINYWIKKSQMQSPLKKFLSGFKI